MQKSMEYGKKEEKLIEDTEGVMNQSVRDKINYEMTQQ